MIKCPDGIKEEDIVYDNNHYPLHLPHIECDPIGIYNASGRQLGYEWAYGDTVVLKINLKRLLPKEEDLETYLSDKSLALVLTNIRGKEEYRLGALGLFAAPITEIPVNTNEFNTVARNTYNCSIILYKADGSWQKSLLKDPYLIYVR